MDIILGIFIFVFVIAAILIGAYFGNKFLSKEDYKDYTLAENFMPQFTGGFSEGDVIRIIHGIYRTGYVIKPTDADWLRRTQQDGFSVVEPQIIWVYSWQVSDLPRGKLSAERNKIKIFPPKPEYFPKGMQNDILGKAMMAVIAKEKAEHTIVQILRSERNFEDDMLKDTRGKNLARTRIKEADDLNYEYYKRNLDDKGKKPAFGDSYT